MTEPLPPHAWSAEALFLKAQRYAQEMLEYPRDDWRYVFWSTLVLELLARAALGKTSPALLAESKNGGSNVVFALGIAPRATKFVPRSVDVSEVFARLALLHPEFTVEIENFCTLHMARRNEELHSGETPLDNLPVSKWLPGYWRACDALLKVLGESLASLIGQTEATAALALIEAAMDEAAKAVQKSVNARKIVWDEKSPEEKAQLSTQAGVWANKRSAHRVHCPACGSVALVDGSPISAPLVKYVDDLIVETEQYLPNKFECVACGLKISGYAQLVAAGVGDSYKATNEYEPTEYFDISPADSMRNYEPDYNEP